MLQRRLTFTLTIGGLLALAFGVIGGAGALAHHGSGVAATTLSAIVTSEHAELMAIKAEEKAEAEKEAADAAATTAAASTSPPSPTLVASSETSAEEQAETQMIQAIIAKLEVELKDADSPGETAHIHAIIAKLQAELNETADQEATEEQAETAAKARLDDDVKEANGQIAAHVAAKGFDIRFMGGGEREAHGGGRQ